MTIEALPCAACTGCSACANICPENAISMERNEEGFYRPVLDKEKCIECGKCQRTCPELYPVTSHPLSGTYYVVQGNEEACSVCDEEPVVYTFARNVIAEKGYFCGAHPDNEMFSQLHLCNEKEFVQGWCKDRMMQPRVEDIYRQIKQMLSEQKKVIFYGIPCQITGLRSYLGYEDKNLVIVDKWCEGVASPASFEKYCGEIVGEIPQWSVYNSPNCFGATSKGVYMKKQDGTYYIGSADQDVFMDSIYSGLNVMESCRDCHYAKLGRQGDITLFDYSYNLWRYPEADEQQKLFLVKINTPKGKALFEAVRPEFKYCVTVSEWKINLDVAFNQPPEVHSGRKRFFELLPNNSYYKALEYSKKGKYDVALLGLWYGRNYGSMLTYYALHQVLRSMNLSVLMISNPLMKAEDKILDKTAPLTFGLRQYEVSPVVPLNQLRELNAYADSFMLGSDQLWNYWLSNPYGQMYYLDFVEDRKKKIAYGTSFGTDRYNGTDFQRIFVEGSLKRFDAVSVREEYAVDICRDTFDIPATKVLDPVFLCKRKEYEKLIAQINPIDAGKYILAYILNPSPEIGQMLQEISRRYEIQVLVILDEPPLKFEQNVAKMALGENPNVRILREVEVREWLLYFSNAERIITDSFHGTCFSIIFEKKFMTIINKKRGFARFPDLLSHYDLMDRLVEGPEQILEADHVSDEIDYKKVYQIIEQDREKSMLWLKDALFSEKQFDINAVYDIQGKGRKY